MKKFFGYIGLFSVVCFSFFMTNKTVDVAKNIDSIMIQIKDNMNDYKVFKSEALIDNDTIIPGINGHEVNVDKSYNYMKKVGIYDPSLYVFDDIKVSNEIKDNLDKYIIKGNKSKKMVSILIYYDKNDIDKIKEKIGDTKINIIASKIDDNILNLSSNYNILIDNKNNLNLYSRIKQNNLYCFNKSMSSDFKDECRLYNAYSINANIIFNRYLYNTKKVLESGLILVYDGNVLNEISTIINYIESKGYKITSLENHLKEER